MTEPNAVTAWVVSAIVGVAALVTKLDPSAVIGAFAGSVTFALTAKDATLWARAIYMIVSLVVGYAAVADVAALSPIKSPLLIAYGISALVVHLTLVAIDRIKSIDLAEFWRSVFSKK